MAAAAWYGENLGEAAATITAAAALLLLLLGLPLLHQETCPVAVPLSCLHGLQPSLPAHGAGISYCHRSGFRLLCNSRQWQWQYPLASPGSALTGAILCHPLLSQWCFGTVVPMLVAAAAPAASAAAAAISLLLLLLLLLLPLLLPSHC